MSDAMKSLNERLAEITDLRNAAGVLGWDQQTMMPPHGAPGRAEALATLERITHERFIDPEIGRLLDAAAANLNGEDPSGERARTVSVVRRRWEKARHVPSALASEIARAASIGQEAWVEARRASDFAAFAPYLERNLELVRRYIDCFDGYECAYDVVLEDYDPGTRTSHVASLFGELKAALVPMIATLSGHEIDTGCLHGHFPAGVQRDLAERVVTQMGFDRDGWRMDEAVHPFATGFGSGDIRITTRWDESYFASGLYGAMHECGHGLYEQGIADALQRTPLGHAESLALHESQSRLWENMVGRGRAFAQVLAPWVGDAFSTRVDPEQLYRAVNRVHPSLIRVEADEATYGLHIILRFELEQELVEGRLAVAELPEAWNARMHEYLGVEVPDDAHGVLQDIHWSAGSIGYFSTYALGNLIAGQLWRRAHEDTPDLEAQIAAGELTGLREWLREHVHRHGAKFTSAELLERVASGPLSVEPFVAYLKAKLSEVYGVAL